MFNYKKGPTKAQKRESKRRWGLIKENLYPLLLENCKSINDMKHRLDFVHQAIKNELVVKVETFKHQLEADKLSTWNVKPLEGKETKLEQTIIDLFADEPVEVVDQILSNLPRIIDSFLYQEMSERSPKSLKVEFPDRYEARS
jgi:hypothetical protein